MKTSHKILCFKCSNFNYHEILFLGGEFEYKCLSCGTYHIILENIHADLEEHLHYYNPERFGYSRYLASYSPEDDKFYGRPNKVLTEFLGVGNVFERFRRLIINYESNSKKMNSNVLNIDVLSNKSKDREYFICNMSYAHFQESLRGFVNMRLHIDNHSGNNTYNILIKPRNDKFDYIFGDQDKMNGIDEIWTIDARSQEYIWYLQRNERDWERSTEICKEVSKALSETSAHAKCISKKTSSIPDGKNYLKNLFKSKDSITLISNSGKHLVCRDVFGILVRRNYDERCGFYDAKLIDSIGDFIKENTSLYPLVILVDREDIENLQTDSIRVSKFDEQNYIFENFVQCIVSTNGSGCNVPSLYDVPMYVVAKTRLFPDDFYCFARMISSYNPYEGPLYGALEKGDYIEEVSLDIDDDMGTFLNFESFKNFCEDNNDKYISSGKK